MTNEVMTEAESLIRIDMLTRERDAMIENRGTRDVVASSVRWQLEVERGVAEFMQRPGYQNGMAKLEEMN